MSKKSRKSKYCVSTQVFVSLLALVLVMGVAVGGTIAWLTATSDTVINTFTTSGISVELKETKTEFKMIPGHTIDKDPKAKVLAGSEECWLFVKLEKSNNFDNFLEYTIADGWTKMDGDSGVDVYYRKIDNSDDAHKIGTAYSVLAGDKVTVKTGVTKAMMNALTDETRPTLTITAYASQLYKDANKTEIPAGTAWTNIFTKAN